MKQSNKALSWIGMCKSSTALLLWAVLHLQEFLQETFMTPPSPALCVQVQLHIVAEAGGAFGSQVVAVILTGLFLVVLGPRLSLDTRPRYPPGLLGCLTWILGWIEVKKPL